MFEKDGRHYYIPTYSTKLIILFSLALLCAAPYAWDEPTLSPLKIQLQIPGGTSAAYSLDRLEEGEQLQYENFIYLIATPTFDK